MDCDIKKLRVGIIGCGRISVRHVGSAMLLPQANLIAVCDIRSEKAQAVAEKCGAKAYTDYKEMIDKENLDCVHICLPHYLHVPAAEYAFGRGVNVLSEKPMSINYNDAVHAVNKAKECGVLYGVIFQSRYNAATIFVKNALDSGKLGKIKSASSVLTWSRSDDYYGGSDWKGTWDKEGGGVVIDTPGLRNLDLWEDDKGIKKTFEDLEELSKNCKFKNCTHQHEPDCYILEIVEKNKIPYDIYQAYITLINENKQLQKTSIEIKKDRKNALKKITKYRNDYKKINKNLKK